MLKSSITILASLGLFKPGFAVADYKAAAPTHSFSTYPETCEVLHIYKNDKKVAELELGEAYVFNQGSEFDIGYDCNNDPKYSGHKKIKPCGIGKFIQATIIFTRNYEGAGERKSVTSCIVEGTIKELIKEQTK